MDYVDCVPHPKVKVTVVCWPKNIRGVAGRRAKGLRTSTITQNTMIDVSVHDPRRTVLDPGRHFNARIPPTHIGVPGTDIKCEDAG